MEIPSAKRTTLQTTLTPIELPDKRRPALELAALLVALAASKQEIEGATVRLPSAAAKAILHALRDGDTMALAAVIAKLDGEGRAVQHVFTALVNERIQSVDRAAEQVKSWLHATEAKIAKGLADAIVASVEATEAAGAAREKRVRSLSRQLDAADRRAFAAALQNAIGDKAMDAVLLDFEKKAAPNAQAVSGLLAKVVASAAEKVRSAVEPRCKQELEGLGSLGLRLRHAMSVTAEDEHSKSLLGALAVLGVKRPEELDGALAYWAHWKAEAPKSLSPSWGSRIAPIGCLHLERMSYVPAGVEHGELVYSLPLAPGEEVAVTHKEWANTDEEFSKLVTDQFEDYSERGVVDKTDMAQASLVQKQHASSFSVSVSASGGYGPVSATTNTAYTAAQAETSSRQSSLSHSQAITQKASARSRREHRTSWRLEKKTGVSDETTRIIKNPDPFHPVRYDFYRLMRKWRVNLHRYGVRLTYDLTIPQPAVDLLEVYAELEELEDLLEKGFELDLPENALTRYNWHHHATAYGIDIEPPPPYCVSVQVMKLSGPFMGDEAKQDHLDEIHVPVPDGYVLACDDIQAYGATDGSVVLFPDPYVTYKHPAPGITSDIGYAIQIDHNVSSLVSVRAWFTLLPDHEHAWHAKAYNLLREAASKAYAEKRQMLEQRRARLLGELAETPALTLRKLEREELMKGFLRWLFGPGFQFAPGGASGETSPFDASGAVTGNAWLAALQHERSVSFLHQAIEWENMNYFLYPYFWTPMSTWRRRLRLRHDDAIHEAFLRAGAARIVLPIRPGWEQAFLSLLATGTLDDSQHPYMTIAEEIQAYAKTNYPGIVPANPEEIDPEEATKRGEGVLIGSWYEYTATSALDIKTGETAPTEAMFNPATFARENPWAKAAPLLEAATEVLKALAKRLTPKD